MSLFKILPFVSSDYIAFCYFSLFEVILKHNWYLNIQLDRNINFPPIHLLHILDFQMLSTETRNQGKKNGNVVRIFI